MCKNIILPCSSFALTCTFLSLLRDLSKSKKTEESTDPIQKLALVISEFKSQTGGQEKTKKLEDTFEEKWFTSKQLGIFLRKAGSFLKLQDFYYFHKIKKFFLLLIVYLFLFEVNIV